MIYLRKLGGEKISSSKINGDAMYNHDKNRIVILNTGENCIGLLNHEFMHKILRNSRLYEACDKWDNKFINKLEKWLGWEKSWFFRLFQHK